MTPVPFNDVYSPSDPPDLYFIVSVCVCKTAPRAVQEEFLRFKEKYGKVYQTKAIEEERFEIFEVNFVKFRI